MSTPKTPSVYSKRVSWNNIATRLFWRQRLAPFARVGRTVPVVLVALICSLSGAPPARRPALPEQTTVPYGGEAELNAEIEREADPRDSMVQELRTKLGQGFDSFRRIKRGFGCVEGKFAPPATDRVDAMPGSANSTMVLLQSVQELKRETSLEASADSSFFGFTASASAKEAQTSESKRTTHYLVVKSKFIGPTVILKPGGKISEVPKKKGSKGFCATCGDEFVNSVDMGAEFFAVLSFEANEAKDFQSIEASLKVAFGQSSASAAFKTAVTSASSQSKTVFRCWRIGGSGPMPKDNDIEAIGNYAAEFTDKIKDVSQLRPIGEKTEQYATLDLSLDPLPDEVLEARDKINKNIDRIEQALAQLNRLPTDYAAINLVLNAEDTKARAALKNELSAALKPMLAAREKCAGDPSVTANCQGLSSVSDFKMPTVPPRPIVKTLVNRTDTYHGQQVGLIPEDYPNGLRFMVISPEWPHPEKMRFFIQPANETSELAMREIPYWSVETRVPPGMFWAKFVEVPPPGMTVTVALY